MPTKYKIVIFVIMGYLVSNDYLPIIQTGDLAASTQNNIIAQVAAENAAVEEAKSHLKQKFDVSAELTNTGQWFTAAPNVVTYPGRKRLNAAAWVTLTKYAIGAQVAQAGNIYQCITANQDAAFTSGNWLLLGAVNVLPYLANDRVYLTATAWSLTAAYAVGDYILYTDNNIYKCNTTIGAGGEVFNPAHWDFVGYNQQLYFAFYPQPLFQIANSYKVGDIVFWRNNIYTCKTASLYPDHDSVIQQNLIQDATLPNSFPDDGVNGSQQWGAGIPYSIPANTDIQNTTYWVQGDNRDAMMVEKLVDMTVYKLMKNISPRNIPLHREKSYMGQTEHMRASADGKGVRFPAYSALGWLQDCAIGDVTPNLPLLQPAQGMRIRYAGKVRQTNDY